MLSSSSSATSSARSPRSSSLRLRASASQQLVAMRYSHVEKRASWRNHASLRHASTNVSCARSSASAWLPAVSLRRHARTLDWWRRTSSAKACWSCATSARASELRIRTRRPCSPVSPGAWGIASTQAWRGHPGRGGDQSRRGPEGGGTTGVRSAFIVSSCLPLLES